MMAELYLDYQRNTRPFPRDGVLLLALASMLLLASAIQFHKVSAEADLWEARAEQAERAAHPQLPEMHAGTARAADLALEIKRANEVLRQLNTPWHGLLQTIESAGSKSVALLALEPDMERQQVKISGEAKNIAATLAYIQRLENRDLFASVYLQSHHVQMQDPEKPVRFVLLAMLREKS